MKILILVLSFISSHFAMADDLKALVTCPTSSGTVSLVQASSNPDPAHNLFATVTGEDHGDRHHHVVFRAHVSSADIRAHSYLYSAAAESLQLGTQAVSSLDYFDEQGLGGPTIHSAIVIAYDSYGRAIFSFRSGSAGTVKCMLIHEN